MPSILRFFLLLCIVQFLGGCHSTWLWGDANDSPARRGDAAELERRALVQNNLDKGLLALQTDRLTLPREDSAVFYFRNVLAIEPDNTEASNGLDRVVNRYLSLAKQAHENGNDKQASSWLKRAEEVRGPTGKSEALRTNLKKTPKGERNREIAYLPADDYLLSREALDERSPEIIKKLSGIARKAESRNRAALVVARTPEEGQWIVKQLHEAVPGYALKTRVQIASRPAIVLMSEKDLAKADKHGSSDGLNKKTIKAIGADQKKVEEHLLKVNQPQPAKTPYPGKTEKGSVR